MTAKVNNAWKTFSLGELTTVHSGGTPNRQTLDYWNGDVPWLSAKDLKQFRLIDSIEKVTEKGARSGTRIVDAGAVLILVRGMTLMKDVPVGVACRAVTFNQDLKALIPNEKVDSYYLAYCLVANKNRLLSLVDQAGHGTGRLATELLSTFDIEVPPLNEQKRIAEILSTWEIAIEETEKLISAKVELKKGLMQQLLTGKKRFPEFAGQEWGKHRIGELLKEVDRYREWNDQELYRLASVRRRSGGLFFRESLYGKQIKTKVLKTIRTGDFLISKMQVVHGAMALTTPDFDGVNVSDSYIALVSRDETKLDTEFFNYMSQMPEMYRLAFLSSYGVHIEKMTFNLEYFLREKISIPPTIDEQYRIVKVLNACNREIELLIRQRDALKAQKRGLMQQLLTGKKRVKVDEQAEVEAVVI